MVPAPPPALLGLGLLLAVGTGLTPLVLGDQLFESALFRADLPWIGTVKSSSVLVFDIGVYLVVLGMTLLLLEQFGSTDGAEDPDDAAGDSGDAPR
jgi:multicomponent Na+:H+ antiporter subunit A